MERSVYKLGNCIRKLDPAKPENVPLVLYYIQQLSVTMEDYNKNPRTEIETNYPEHKENPGPAKEAVTERDDQGAGNTIKWVIAIAVIALIIAYFIFGK